MSKYACVNLELHIRTHNNHPSHLKQFFDKVNITAQCNPQESIASEWMNERLTCDFMSFSTVFQSYQDSELVIMKGCEQWNSVYH